MTVRESAVRHARLRPDVRWRDLAFGLARCVVPTHGGQRPSEQQGVAALWPEPYTVVPCLSVRSGFDLVLSCTGWPPGTEVLMSAITIPQMAAIVRLHGFVPVAIDVDPDTLVPDADALRRAVTARTKAVVCSSLFGMRPDLAPLIRASRDAGLLMIEDRAQAFSGTTEALGDADVAMYSFGTIKTATSLGGAVLLVRDPILRATIDRQQRSYPRQSRAGYLSRLAKGWLMLWLSRPEPFAAFTGLVRLAHRDHDRILRNLSRTFPDAELLTRIRRRPSTPLLAMMRRRLSTYDPGRVRRRGEAGRRLAVGLRDRVPVLGGQAPHHSFWLFPVLTDNPEALVARGRAAGYDFTTGSSILASLDPGCRHAAQTMQRVVYLPLSPAMTERELNRLVAAVGGTSSRRTATNSL